MRFACCPPAIFDVLRYSLTDHILAWRNLFPQCHQHTALRISASLPPTPPTCGIQPSIVSAEPPPVTLRTRRSREAGRTTLQHDQSRSRPSATTAAAGLRATRDLRAGATKNGRGGVGREGRRGTGGAAAVMGGMRDAVRATRRRIVLASRSRPSRPRPSSFNYRWGRWDVRDGIAAKSGKLGESMSGLVEP